MRELRLTFARQNSYSIVMNIRQYLLVFIVWGIAAFCPAQRNAKFEAYIEHFAPIAVAEMHAHGIPASITLAQGLLESGAGSSLLATRGNNHFGIKTGSDWTGPYMLKDDDAPNEQFRVYADAAQSYADHSLFLRNRQRYASLFALSLTDYKGWAHGLKACGYATSPTYADRLIQIIETYDLARYDLKPRETAYTDQPASTSIYKPTATTVPPVSRTQRSLPILFQNGTYYVIAQTGETYRTIGQRWGVREGTLRRYNEQPRGYQPRIGERVYLMKKPARAEKRYKGFFHQVQAGESLHTIAQAYAVRTRTLYRLNRLPDTYIPRPGDRLRIR